MNQYSKASAQMRKEGVNAFTKGDGGVFIQVGNGRYFEVELSLGEVQRWADLYDADKERKAIEDMKDTDPLEVLEEIARIFHHLGWDLGDNGAHDTSFIESSEAYLELVCKAFNPIYKK